MKKELIIEQTFDKDGFLTGYKVNGEVVRCKDCRFYIQSNEKCELVDTRLHFYETDKTWAEDCFCSWGERRSE